MTDDPLQMTLLDLDLLLGGNAGLCLGGGYGLYLKQLFLHAHPEISTLFPPAAIPTARTTQDIDLFLRAEIIAEPRRMSAIRDAIDKLGFSVVDSARYMQFVRPLAAGYVKIDLLAGPMGELADRVRFDSRRIKPLRSVNLHARRVDEAIGIEERQIQIPVAGRTSSGNKHATTVLVPQAFSYLMMKLLAFRDQLANPEKNLGRHHALDVYRIVGLITDAEDASVRELAVRYQEEANMLDARRVVMEHFGSTTSLGLLRIREHPLASRDLELDRFRRELVELFPPLA